MLPTGVNMTNVKQINRSAVLQLLLRNGGMSRTDLAEELNLTTATLTSICNDFIQKGLLIQSDGGKSQSPGRKKCPLDINGTYKYAIAVSLHYNGHIIAITDLRGQAVASTSFSVEAPYDAEHFFKKLADACIRLLWENNIPCERVLGACVCIVGSVDQEAGVSLNPFSIFGEGQVPIRQLLEKELPFPICVENNVCAFLNAEILLGCATDSNVIALKWGPGVGSASSIGGVICKDHTFHSSEIGHTYFYRNDGRTCKCGRRGCLETGVNLSRIEEKILELLPGEPALQQVREAHGAPHVTNIISYLTADCPALRGFFEACVHDLAIGVNNAIQVFSPDRVILYGVLFEVPGAADRFIDEVVRLNPFIGRELFQRSALSWKTDYIGPAATAIKTYLIDTGGEA